MSSRWPVGLPRVNRRLSRWIANKSARLRNVKCVLCLPTLSKIRKDFFFIANHFCHAPSSSSFIIYYYFWFYVVRLLNWCESSDQQQSEEPRINEDDEWESLSGRCSMKLHIRMLFQLPMLLPNHPRAPWRAKKKRYNFYRRNNTNWNLFFFQQSTGDLSHKLELNIKVKVKSRLLDDETLTYI